MSNHHIIVCDMFLHVVLLRFHTGLVFLSVYLVSAIDGKQDSCALNNKYYYICALSFTISI